MFSDSTKTIVPRNQSTLKLVAHVCSECRECKVFGLNSTCFFSKCFIYPLMGPSRKSIIRMGNHAAVDHSHHRSLWWRHNYIDGFNFCEETKSPDDKPQIRQTQWLHYLER